MYKTLEQEYSKHLGIDCISVNTGTAAIHVALEALKLPRGSKVIVPDFTMYASALAVYYARLDPVFVDCDRDLLIDLDAVERTIDEKTKVLMVTHIYGRIVNMDRVMEIARKHNLRVIEDACEAQGAKWNDIPVGTFDIGCFSLYRNKIIHAEEGGIVASKDKEFLKIVEDMKNMSFGETHDYTHEQIGFNYRMTDSQASLALKSLRQVEKNITKRESIKNKFNDLFPEKFKMEDNREVVWVYDMRHPYADRVVNDLKEIGIKARHAFKPMSLQPLFSELRAGSIDNIMSLYLSDTVFYLHIDINWAEEDITNIYNKTIKILEKHDI